MPEQNQFDVGREIALTIPGPSPKTVRLRFPSDQQWIDRAAGQRTSFRALGHGESTPEPSDTGKLDAEIVAECRVDGGAPEIDEAEATLILDRLARCEATECDLAGSDYSTVLRVPGATTKHRLKAPSVAAVQMLKRAYEIPVIGRRGFERRKQLRPVGEFYDAHVISATGYVGKVPIVHQAAVVAAVVDAINTLIEGDGSGF